MQSALHVQSTLLYTSHSTTSGHLPHNALVLRRAEPVPQQLDEQLNAALAEQLQENHDTVEQSAVR
jgi:hypothetical protein